VLVCRRQDLLIPAAQVSEFIETADAQKRVADLDLIETGESPLLSPPVIRVSLFFGFS
jgi:hypothetical protein